MKTFKKHQLLYVAILLIILWFVFPFILKYLPPVFNHQMNIGEMAQIGDSYGVLNSLFSGLAFAGLIVTISLQREDLKNQREELQLTRNEIEKSREAQQGSEKALNLQVELLIKQAILNAYQSDYEIQINIAANPSYDIKVEPRKSALEKAETLRVKINSLINEIETISLKLNQNMFNVRYMS